MPYKTSEGQRAAERRWYARLGGERRKKYLEKRRIRASKRYWALSEEERKAYGKKQQKYRTPAGRRREHLKGRYGMTVEQWEAMFDAQGRCCAICNAETSGWNRGWHTDHDHKTGKVRGILCHACNRLLGQVKDEVSRLQDFIEYLRQPEPRGLHHRNARVSEGGAGVRPGPPDPRRNRCPPTTPSSS